MTTFTPIWGTPASQMRRAKLSDAKAGLGLHVEVNFGLAGRLPSSSMLTFDGLQQLLSLPDDTVTSAVRALGAQGTITRATIINGAYRYDSTQDGPTLPFAARLDQTFSAHVLATSEILDLVIDFGQSWATISQPLVNLPDSMMVATETHTVFAPVDNGGAFSANLGRPNGYAFIVDIGGITPSTPGAQLGKFTSISRVRQRRAANKHITPICDVVPAFPGAIWPALQPGTAPWTALLAMHAAIQGIAPHYGMAARVRMIRWTDGVPNDGTGESEYSDLTAFMAALDGANLNGDGSLQTIFGDQTPALATATNAHLGCLDQVQFSLDNPVRYVNIGPRYAYELRDTVHHTARGFAQLAEVRAFIENLWFDYIDGQKFLSPSITDQAAINPASPPWTVLHVVNEYIVGTTLTLDCNQPMPGVYAALQINTTFIEADVQLGFRIKINGAFVGISNVQVVPNSTRITMTLAVAPQPTDTIERSYAYYGPGEAAGTHAGAWGNIALSLADSLFFPGETIYAWLAIDKVTLSAANFVNPPILPVINSIALSSTTMPANPNAPYVVGTLTAATSGAVDAITWSLDDDAGASFLITSGSQISSIANLPAGSWSIVVRASADNTEAITAPFTIVAS